MSVSSAPSDIEGARVDRAVQPAPVSPWREAFRYAVMIVVTLRVAFALFMLLGLGTFPHRVTVNRFGQTPPAGWGMVFTAWERWDALWYLSIAEGGYVPDNTMAWWPLYPLTLRLLRPLVGGSSLGAALLLSTIALVGALAVLYVVTATEFDTPFARRSVLYVAISPAAFFLLAPYSESLFLLLAALTFWAARRQRFLLAGLFAGLTSASRSTGILLAIPILIEVVHTVATTKGPTRWPRLASGVGGLLLVPSGLLAYLLYWQLRAGDALLPLREQQTSWGHQLTWPWDSVIDGLRSATSLVGVPNQGIRQVELLVTLASLALLIWLVMRAPAAFSAWTFAMLLFPLSTPIPGFTLLSTPRYFAVVFPLAWGAAWLSERFSLHSAIVGITSALLALLTVLFSLGYRVY